MMCGEAIARTRTIQNQTHQIADHQQTFEKFVLFRHSIFCRFCAHDERRICVPAEKSPRLHGEIGSEKKKLMKMMVILSMMFLRVM